MVRAPRLKKRHGQHHLLHRELCRPLLDFLRPDGRRVVEIGPGGGLLTGELLRAGAGVWAWEVDPEWALRLADRLRDPRLATVAGDALELPWERLPAGTLVTGNLPYGIATRLIGDLLDRAAGVRRAAFLVQAEVAARLAAGAGESDYGALSVLVQARAEIVRLGRVRRGSFRPPPKVDGAFVGLERRPPLLPARRWAGFEAMVRLAFAQRRKTLRNTLGRRWGRDAVDRLLAARGLPPAARATRLEPLELIELHAESVRRGMS